MIACIFDTETTGKYDYKAPATAEHQPDVVQLCAYLADKERIYNKLSIYIHEETEIPEGAYEVHRIDRAMTARVGVSRVRACQIFDSFARRADVLVGHNVDFDVKIMLAANYRSNGKGEALKKPTYCTMKNSTELCKIPNPDPRFTSFKWPTLQEAYTALVDPRGFDGAHDAEADVKAAYELFRTIHR